MACHMAYGLNLGTNPANIGRHKYLVFNDLQARGGPPPCKGFGIKDLLQKVSVEFAVAFKPLQPSRLRKPCHVASKKRANNFGRAKQQMD
jgi:hypothetical protein